MTLLLSTMDDATADEIARRKVEGDPLFQFTDAQIQALGARLLSLPEQEPKPARS